MTGDVRLFAGWQIIGSLGAVTFVSILLILSPSGFSWVMGECLLGLGMLQWFIVLHEAGHGTLFSSKKLNFIMGHVASVFCAIPFTSWRHIHRLHHVWTGWRNIDPTTESTLPKTLSPIQKKIMRLAWTSGFPLFSIIYRLDTYWNLSKLKRSLESRPFISSRKNILFLGIFYLMCIFLLKVLFVKLFVLPFLISLVLADPILMSQHNHVTMRLAPESNVKPFPAGAQIEFTRELVAPQWVSRYILLGFDRHALHHKYPTVPGYRLPFMRESVPIRYGFFDWIRRAKQIPADQLVFSHRAESGLDI